MKRSLLYTLEPGVAKWFPALRASEVCEGTESEPPPRKVGYAKIGRALRRRVYIPTTFSA
jgi:hypothetical protein